AEFDAAGGRNPAFLPESRKSRSIRVLSSGFFFLSHGSRGRRVMRSSRAGLARS
uniref:Uncharacterized protein n=1 Tax=Aegilops tauschii subsp. strangulata TaxID=200361 RepID=A0A453M6R6_AEGTS